MKILVVDDEPNILMSLEFLMKKSGFEVFIARNGHEALNIIRKEKPGIVILDIMMPDLDGYAICSYIRQESPIPEAKVVFLSAKSKTADIEKGYGAGADRYITKPFSTRKLIEEVKELATAHNNN